CARFPGPLGSHVRLESGQNAVGQAKRFAANITRGPEAYAELPWFGSDQGSLRQQIVGPTTEAEAVITQPPSPDALVVQAFRNGVLIGVEALNAPAQFVRARRVLSGPVKVTYELAKAADWSLDRYMESLGAVT